MDRLPEAHHAELRPSAAGAAPGVELPGSGLVFPVARRHAVDAFQRRIESESGRTVQDWYGRFVAREGTPLERMAHGAMPDVGFM